MAAVAAPSGGAQPVWWYIEYYTSKAGNLEGRVVQGTQEPVPSGNIDSVSPAFGTYQDALNALNQNSPMLGGPVSEPNFQSNPIGSVGSVIGETAPSIPGFSGIDAIGNFFNKLSEKSLWIRVGEGVAALILLDLGLKSLTGTSIIEKSGKAITGGTKTAAKAAMFA